MESGGKQVIVELENSFDKLPSWVKTYKNSIIDDTEEIQKVVAYLVNKYKGWVNPDSTKNQADPYVIAVAKVYSCTVVTRDGVPGPNPYFFPTNQSTKKSGFQRMLEQPHRISTIDICENENIPWLDLVEFLVEQLPEKP